MRRTVTTSTNSGVARREPIFWKIVCAFAALCALWMAVPLLFGFNAAEMSDWGSLADAPEIIAAYQARRTGTVEIIFDDGNTVRVYKIHTDGR